MALDPQVLSLRHRLDSYLALLERDLKSWNLVVYSVFVVRIDIVLSKFFFFLCYFVLLEVK